MRFPLACYLKMSLYAETYLLYTKITSDEFPSESKYDQIIYPDQ